MWLFWAIFKQCEVFQTSELLLGQERLLSWTHMCEGCCAPTILVLTNDHIIINLTSFLLCLRAAVMQQQPLASKLLDSFPRGNLLRPPRMSCVALSLSLVVQLWMKHKPDLNHTIVSLYLVGPDRQSGLLRRVTSSSSSYSSISWILGLERLVIFRFSVRFGFTIFGFSLVRFWNQNETSVSDTRLRISVNGLHILKSRWSKIQHLWNMP